MSLYTVYYEFLDKRGYTRSKKLLCNGNDILKQKCTEISKLTEHKPISTPLIYITTGIDQLGEMVDFESVMRGDIDETPKRR